MRTTKITDKLRGIFSRAEVRGDTITADQTLTDLLSGRTVPTVDAAMSIPSFAGCVAYIADTIAGMPVRLYRDIDGKTEEVTDDVRVRFLNDECGDTLTAYQIKRAVVADYLITGAGYVYIDWRRNSIDGLRYVRSCDVASYKNEDPIFRTNRILCGGREYQPYQFLRFYRHTRDGCGGVGVLAESPLPIALMYSVLQFETRLTRTGGGKRGFLQAKSKLTKDVMDELRKQWNELQSGGQSVMVLNDGTTFQDSASTALEMEFKEIKQKASDDICKLFGLSAAVINGTADSQSIADTTQTSVLPVTHELESALNRDLLLECEKRNMYFALDCKELLRGDIQKRYAAYKTALDANFMGIDEVRYEENLPPLGIDFVRLGLQDVLYYPDKRTLYVPNTKENIDLTKGGTMLDN